MLMMRSRAVLRHWRSLALLLLAAMLLTGCELEGQSAFNPAGLPPEALETLTLIRQGGPFPYRKDGSTFHNRERLLPDKPRGYYREYTVSTPGSPDRGARRIVTGGHPPEVFYYTADHYRSFRLIKPTQ